MGRTVAVPCSFPRFDQAVEPVVVTLVVGVRPDEPVVRGPLHPVGKGVSLRCTALGVASDQNLDAIGGVTTRDRVVLTITDNEQLVVRS